MSQLIANEELLRKQFADQLEKETKRLKDDANDRERRLNRENIELNSRLAELLRFDNRSAHVVLKNMSAC